MFLGYFAGVDLVNGLLNDLVGKVVDYLDVFVPCWIGNPFIETS